mmetsp:Transcript_8122/g.8998  ORF Transcript_8122/g.8998 Transcript_8122/m.8998 type:complete len:90 (-) Transcript_8122:26-295(-)
MVDILKDWKDVWPLLHDTKGWTFDTTANTMLKDHRDEHMRYDRVVTRSSKWKPTMIKLLGDSPISSQGSDTSPVFPSDHFGLACELTFQ